MINPVFQEKLMSALHDAVGHFNGGMNPTDAVTKAANDYSFNPDQATRLGETFNTARTIYHFDKTANTDDKCATFELADNAKVVLNLFNKKETKKEASLMDYSFYNQIPQDHTLTDIDISFSKAADVDIEGLTLDNQGNRIRRVVSIYNSLAEEAFSKSASAEWEVDNVLGKIASVLKQGYINKGTDVVDRLFFIFKDAEYEPVLSKLAVKLPEYLKVDDSRRGSYGLVIEDRDLNELKAHVKRAKALLMDAAELKAVGTSIEKDAKDLDDEFTSLFLTGCPEKEGETVSDFFTDEANNASLNKSAQSKDPKGVGQIFGEAASGLAAPVEQSLGSSFSDNFGKFLGEGVKEVFTHEKEQKSENNKASERLRNVQRTVMLEDLMINDPVISDMDPAQVASMYQGIISLAPEVSTQKEIVRSMLRLQGSQAALSPFDAKQYADLEKIMRENLGVAPERRVAKA